MRMANDRDQAIVKSAVSDAAAGLLGFLPSLGTREVFAFGEGVALPTRLKFAELPPEVIPRSEAIGRGRMDGANGVDTDFIAAVVQRWRGAMMSHKLTPEPDELDVLAADEFTRLQPAEAPVPNSLGYGSVRKAAVNPENSAFPAQNAQGQFRGVRK
jgi:hypothetical protein